MFDGVRLISFDLDDTLWPCEPVIRAAEAEAYHWLNQHAPRLTERFSIADLRNHRLAHAAARPTMAHDLTAVRAGALAVLLQSEGYPEGLADEATAVFRRARNQVTPYAEVVDALAALRNRYTLVSVTNGNAEVERTPLHASFHFSLTAAEVGAAKPDPAIFAAASARSGIPYRGCLHVGDDPLRDVAAARALGVRTVWVNRSGRDWPAGLPPADLEVGDIAQLVGVLTGGVPA